MSKRARRSFTPQFKAEAAALVRASGKTVHQVAKDLDLTETALRDRVIRATGSGSPIGKGPSSQSEHEELVRLRKENRMLQMERDFLKKAAAVFAKENK